MIEIARTLNPSVAVVIRTHDEEEAALLRNEYQVDVFFSEHELARNRLSLASVQAFVTKPEYINLLHIGVQTMVSIAIFLNIHQNNTH